MTVDSSPHSHIEMCGHATACGDHPSSSKQQFGNGNTNVSDATKLWQDRLHPLALSQPVLHCFPMDYQWPRSETAIIVPDGLLEQALEVCTRLKIRLDDLLYGTWAIVAAQHTSGSQNTAFFTIAGRENRNPSPLLEQHKDVQDTQPDVPLLLSVSQDTTILSYLRHVGEIASEATANGFLGHDHILRITNTKKPQVKLSVNFEDPSFVQDDVMAADDEFPLVINVSVSPLMKLSMRHSASLAKLDARVLLEHFTVALHYVTGNVKAKLSTVQLISNFEEFLLYEYGKAAVPWQSGLLHHLIETQAQLTPEADALQFESDIPISYSALNQQSNQLARHIVQYKPNFVAIHMRTSTTFIIALLAVLKAGAAYVILDVDAAQSRKAFMVEDVAADFVLVDRTTRGQFGTEYEITDIMFQSSQNDDTNLATTQEPTETAYVIYTSGSTGKPKAAQLDHQAAYNGLASFPKIENLRQLLFFNPVFSAAQRSMWATLSVGGCLCLAEKRNFTVNLADTINKMNINSIDMTSTTAALIHPGQVPSLQRVVLGGELVNPAVVETWAHRVQLYSSYGLSECTQLNWRHRLRADGSASSRVIGQPYDTTTSYIVDPDTMQLSPLLIPGELCLGGAQIARGYINSADETTKRFVKNPFGQGRIYKTGDMAVRHADGSIELIGRVDFQTKINGQRVDPGEPNSHLQKSESVKHSAVVPCLVKNRTVLVATIVTARGDVDWADTVHSLRAYLATRVPAYMMPSFWVQMPKLPLNANDKVDMAAIRNMVEDSARSGTLEPAAGAKEVDDAVFSDKETTIRSLWAEFLSIPSTSITLNHSLVSLGGTSLEAIQIVSRLQSRHCLILAVEDIILDNSLAEVANLAKEMSASETLQAPAPFSLLKQALSLKLLGVNDSEVEDAFPVTALQEAVIANAIMGGTVYTYSRSYSFHGHSEQDVTRGLQSLMESQPLLRTTFVPNGTSFVQVIKKTAILPLVLSSLDTETYIKETTAKLMSIGELWWRAAFLPGQVLVITSHHALFDYWSNEFVPQDLSSILSGNVPVSRAKFSGYVKYLQEQDVSATKNFWTGYLDGAKPKQLGPQTSDENTVTASLGIDIKKMASNLKVTPSTLLYAAWSVVLSTVHSTDDVVMGITLSGRDSAVSGILDMSGPTLMIAPLRVQVNQTSPFDAHLAHVQQQLWDVASHAHFGLRNIFKTSGQSKELFDSMVNFLIKIPPPNQDKGLKALPFTYLGSVEHAKLELNNETLDHITLASTLESGFAHHLVDLVVSVLQNGFDGAIVPIKDLLPAAVPKEEDEEIAEASAPSLDEPVVLDEAWPYTSPDLGYSAFMRMAAEYPSRTAVYDISGNDITYAGLAIKIHQLAGVLRAKGVKLEQVVPMLLEKSINTIISIFGILASGSALLPLGPENPRDRNLGIMEDCEATHIITDRLNKSFFDGLSYHVIVIDDTEWNSLPIERPVTPGLNPDSLAYVIYTSGSTGKPKGTLITHGSLAAATEGIIDTTNLRDNPFRILWTLNYTFDGSFDGLFSALSSGSTLCLAPQSTIIANLADYINTMQVDRVNITPSMSTLFHPDEVPHLRVLMTGGEAIIPHILAVWAPRVVVYNAYGPTEATIAISTNTVTPDMNLRSVGRLFKSVESMVLDPDTLNPVEDGQIGELCVSGPQLARGYLKRPEATAKAFRLLGQKRIYQTGDLARVLPNGEVELYGRKDDQIKLNGYRIELGEIESSIIDTGTFETCVPIIATVMKKKQIVAFCSDVKPENVEASNSLLLPPEQAIAVHHVTSRLTSLPKYMIPTIWLPVSTFPLTPNGKIDRKQLRQVVEEMPHELLKDYLPREEKLEVTGEQEVLLRSIWAGLFEVEMDDIHGGTTFHSLGGDSISALNLVGMLRRAGYDVKVNDLISAASLQAQARLLSEEHKIADNVEEAKELPPFVPSHKIYTRLKTLAFLDEDIEEIYPCSPGQVEFLTQGNKHEQFWQLMTLRELPSDVDFARWIELTETLTAKNQILRAVYVYGEQGNTETAVQVILKQPTLNLRCQSYTTDDEMKQIVDAEWELLFDPAKAFVRYVLLTNSKTGARHVLIKLDHASYDGTLLHIFDDQFKALHRGLEPLPSTEFRDFINHVRSTPKEPQLNYWTNLLKGMTFTYPDVATNPRICQWQVSTLGLDAGVDDIAQSAGVTAPIVFQSAYSLLLSHLSGSQHVVYNNLITGRNVPLDNPQLINGNCANFLPFYCNLQDSGTTPTKTLLQQTQAAFWDATENGLVSLGDIYKALGQGDRDAAAAKCLFCFQPFEPVAAQQDPMRWIVMKMSKNRMEFNYAIQLEVVKGATKGEYVIKFGFDERVFTTEEAQDAVKWYSECVKGMAGA